MNSTYAMAPATYSFWTSKKKRLFIAAGLLVCVFGAAGFGIYYYQTHKADSANAQAILPGAWVKHHFALEDQNDPKVGGLYGDPDSDGITNYQEYILNTSPVLSDSDKDGISDGVEVSYNTNPLVADATVDASVPNPSQFIAELSDGLATNGIVDRGEIERLFQPNRPLVVPKIEDAQLKIVSDSAESEQAYISQRDLALQQYNDGTLFGEIQTVLGANTGEEISAYKNKVGQIMSSLYSMPVPRSLVSQHKSFIVYVGALQKIVEVKEQMLLDPDDITLYGELVYQTRILATGEDFALGAE